MSKTLNVTSLLPLHTITREVELEDTFCCFFFSPLISLLFCLEFGGSGGEYGEEKEEEKSLDSWGINVCHRHLKLTEK